MNLENQFLLDSNEEEKEVKETTTSQEIGGDLPAKGDDAPA